MEGGGHEWLKYLWSKSIFAIETNIFTDNDFYKYDIPRYFLQAKHIRDDCFSFVKFKSVSDVTLGGGGILRNLPRIIFGLNGVKSCYFRQYKHGNGTFIKVRDSVYEGRDNPLNLEVIRIFFFKYLHFV